MRIVNDHARVKVPATSGNLGPGFDTMGMAHDVWDEVSVTMTTGATHVTILGEGHNTLAKDESHLIVRAMRHTLEKVGVAAGGIEMVCRNEIPHGKGLGSSAAAVVAGILLVRGLIDRPDILTDKAVLDIACEFEGHPDNAAPAIYGGATLSWKDDAGYNTVSLNVSDSVTTTLLVPDAVLLTSEARAVLPAQIPHADGAFNASRAGLLVHALEHRPDLLFAATEDRLHQDYRASAMPASAKLLEALRASGWPAIISGAGPSILLFGNVDSAMANIFAQQGFRTVNSRQVGGAYLVD